MIVGVGMDVTSVARIERALERFGGRFWDRVLTVRERADLERRGGNRAEALAGRFAAKEAASKALGAPRDVWWRDVEIARGELGKPELFFLGPGAARALGLNVARSFVSISHDAGVAVAVVILEAD